MDRKSRLLSSWILRLIGATSIATVVIGVCAYWYKRYSTKRRIDKKKRDGEPGGSHSQQSGQSSSTNATDTTWSSKLFGGVSMRRKNRKRMTISMKNTVLWNPSPDMDTPMFAFREDTIALLIQLAHIYDIYIIIHVNSEDEQSVIKKLLEKASSTGGLFTDKDLIDSRKILFCSQEEGKVHIIRHIEPHIHVEGGWEMDDGEDIVRKLKPFIHKIIWIISKRRRDSFKPQSIDEKDRDRIGINIEMSETLTDTSIARECI